VIYQIAQAYALNHGFKFVPDKLVSPLAQARRPSHMLSSALRHGTTEHLGARGQQEFELPQWTYGKDLELDIGVLAAMESEYARARIGDFDRDLQISVDGNSILDADGNALGENPGRDVEGYLSGGREPALTGIGETTLLRALVTSHTANGKPFALGLHDPGILDADWASLSHRDPGGEGSVDLLRQGGEQAGDQGRVVKNILYSAPAGDAGGAAGNPLDRLPPVYRRAHGAATAGTDVGEIARREGISLKAVGNILRDVNRWLGKNSPFPSAGKASDAAHGALDRLPPIYQRVHLAAQEGEDEEEIARREQISVKAVGNILRDTRRVVEGAAKIPP
jgi:hypothetical protein